MVCGRLPFGDDSQVKKQQKHGLSFPSSRTISRAAKKLIIGILNPSIEERLDTYDIILHDWTASQPVKAPQPLSPTPKYTVDSCLSMAYHQTNPHLLQQNIVNPQGATNSHRAVQPLSLYGHSDAHSAATLRETRPFASTRSYKRAADALHQLSAPGPATTRGNPM